VFILKKKDRVQEPRTHAATKPTPVETSHNYSMDPNRK